MSTLTGVYRALSFMCLGLVLVAIGWLYQRILFRRQAAAAAACSGGRLIAQAARAGEADEQHDDLMAQAAPGHLRRSV